MKSLSMLIVSMHSRPISRSVHGRNTRLSSKQTRRCTLSSPWRGGGSSGSGGRGGGNDESFGSGDGDGFYSQNFDLFAAFILFSEEDNLKLPHYTIAQGVGEEQDIETTKEKDEPPEFYVKPAPKPKPMSLNFQPGMSWMLMLLLVSGGVFLWRRARNRNTAPREEADTEALVERTADVQRDTLPEQPAEPATEETVQDGARESGRTPDFDKEIEEQDALFDVERDVKIEKQPSGIESANPSHESLPPKTEASPEASKPAAVTDVVPPPPPPPAAVTDVVPPPPPPPAALEKAREVETPIETYYEDLEKKDKLFPNERRSSEKKEPESEPASSPGPSLVSVLLIPDTQNPESIKLVFEFMEKCSTKELEKEPCARWALSPTSQNDEGSNQSAATNFYEAHSLTAEAHEPDSPLSEKELEDYDFEHLPKKFALIEEDLGPPIKPTAVDFTKPSEWEHEAPATKIGNAITDDRTKTMQYLLSNAELLAEALKVMESGSTPIDESKLMPQMPNSAPVTSSKKSKRRKSKKKKSTTALH